MLIKYCITCFLPSTKPDLFFDHTGKCSACIAYEKRSEINWDSRSKEFAELLEKSRKMSNSSWDCIVPVSGGKDSTAQVIKVMNLGAKPLCVTSSTCDLTQIGRSNIENIKNLGVDLIEFSPNPNIRRKLNRIALEEVGDISWPEHVGIFTIPVIIAEKFNINLIIWGENSQNEYGGPLTSQNNRFLDRSWLEEFGGLLGLRVTDFLSTYNLKVEDLIPYTYPSREKLERIGIQGIFLGYFFPWDGVANYLLSTAHGFNNFGKVIDGSSVSYENLDNFQHGIHDYFKFLKFGFGRATDLVSIHMRRGLISREEGLQIIKKNDGRYPKSYLGKNLSDILAPLDLSVESFNLICDKFTNRSLFKSDESGKLIRDGENLVKVNYDNEC
jgi:N-acetyl sugar amidotransferase